MKIEKTIINLSLIINKYPKDPTKRDTKNSPILSNNNFAPLSTKSIEIILKYINKLSNIIAIKGEGNLIFITPTSHWQRKFKPIIKDNDAIILNIFIFIILSGRFYLIFIF